MAGGLGSAYGQTDVMHDRSYLISQMANRSRAIRQQAAAALDNLDRQQALQQRDQALQQHQMAQEATQRRITAHQNAMEMDKQLKIDRDTEIDEQGHALQFSLMQLEAQLRRGQISRDQFHDGMLNAVGQYHLGLKNPEAAKHYEFVSKEFGDHNAFNERRQYAEAAKISAKYGVPVQTDPTTGAASIQATRDLAANTPQGQIDFGQLRPAPEKIAQRYARVQGTLDQYQAALDSDIKRQEATNIAAKIEKAPYNPNLDKDSRIINSNLTGARTEAQFLEQSYPQLTGQVQPVQSAVNTPIPQPTPEPSPTPDTRPIPGFNIPELGNTTPDQTPIYTPSPSPEATATPSTTPTIDDLFPAP